MVGDAQKTSSTRKVWMFQDRKKLSKGDISFLRRKDVFWSDSNLMEEIRLKHAVSGVDLLICCFVMVVSTIKYLQVNVFRNDTVSRSINQDTKSGFKGTRKCIFLRLGPSLKQLNASLNITWPEFIRKSPKAKKMTEENLKKLHLDQKKLSWKDVTFRRRKIISLEKPVYTNDEHLLPGLPFYLHF